MKMEMDQQLQQQNIEAQSKANAESQQVAAQAEVQKQLRMMPGQEKMVMDFYQKNPSAISNLKASLFEKKVLEFVKSKSQSNLIEFSIDEAEKFIKDFNSKKIESTTKSSSGKSQKTDKLKKKNKK